MCTIDAVKFISVDRVLTLNVAHQQPFEGNALLVQIWRTLESEEVRSQYTQVVSFCSNMATFTIHVSDLAKPIIKFSHR